MITLHAPTTLSRDRYVDLIHFLGFNPRDVKLITFYPTHIEVQISARNDQGNMMVIKAEDRIAVHRIEIPITPEGKPKRSPWTGLPC